MEPRYGSAQGMTKMLLTGSDAFDYRADRVGSNVVDSLFSNHEGRRCGSPFIFISRVIEHLNAIILPLPGLNAAVTKGKAEFSLFFVAGSCYNRLSFDD